MTMKQTSANVASVMVTSWSLPRRWRPLLVTRAVRGHHLDSDGVAEWMINKVWISWDGHCAIKMGCRDS